MNNQHQRGSVVVETAITMFVLFLLLFGIMEFGRAFNMYQVLTDAAREGARFSVAPDPANSYGLPAAQQVADRACNFLKAASVQVSCTVNTNLPAGSTCNSAGTLPNTVPSGIYVVQCPVADPVSTQTTTYTEVDIAAPYNFLFFPYGTMNLRTRAVMRNEDN